MGAPVIDRRTVVGLPVVLATVYARTLLAQDTTPGSTGTASLDPSAGPNGRVSTLFPDP
jgi:hypothetical protein